MERFVGCHAGPIFSGADGVMLEGLCVWVAGCG